MTTSRSMRKALILHIYICTLRIVSVCIVVAGHIDTIINIIIYFFTYTHCLLSSFWTSRVVTDVVCPFPLPVLAFNFYRARIIGFSNPTARRFFIEWCKLTLSRFPLVVNLCTRKIPMNVFIRSSVHPGGFELKKLTSI